MTALEPYLLLILVFSPLLAAIFTTMIPRADLGSKNAITKSFAAICFLIFLRIAFRFLQGGMAEQEKIVFDVLNFRLSLSLNFNEKNIFLFASMSFALLIHAFFLARTYTANNLHEVSPFLLTFLAYLIFGQDQIQVALPLVALSGLILYFLIGFTNKLKRGATIYQMGIFLFSLDALPIILIHLMGKEEVNPYLGVFLSLIILAPGLSRLCLPMAAPFLKKSYFKLG